MKHNNVCDICGQVVVPDHHYNLGPIWFINLDPLVVRGHGGRKLRGEIYGHRECLEPVNDQVIAARISRMMERDLARRLLAN